MFVVDEFVDRHPLSRQALFQPVQRGGYLRILVPQPLQELDGEDLGQARMFVSPKHRADRLGGLPVHAQQAIGQAIRFLASRPVAHDAPGRAAEILHQDDSQRDGDRP